jgi:predicted dinucleotide-binding enzyme
MACRVRRQQRHKAAATIKALAEQLGFSPIRVGWIDEGGRLLHIPVPWFFTTSMELGSAPHVSSASAVRPAR